MSSDYQNELHHRNQLHLPEPGDSFTGRRDKQVSEPNMGFRMTSQNGGHLSPDALISKFSIVELKGPSSQELASRSVLIHLGC